MQKAVEEEESLLLLHNRQLARNASLAQSRPRHNRTYPSNEPRTALFKKKNARINFHAPSRATTAGRRHNTNHRVSGIVSRACRAENFLPRQCLFRKNRLCVWSCLLVEYGEKWKMDWAIDHHPHSLTMSWVSERRSIVQKFPRMEHRIVQECINISLQTNIFIQTPGVGCDRWFVVVVMPCLLNARAL